MTEPPHPAVLGIDTNTFGFHVVSDVPIEMPGQTELSCIGWALDDDRDAGIRRHRMFNAAYDFFVRLPKASAVFVEEPLVLRSNIETTRKLVMVGGVMEAAFWQACPDAVLFWVDVAAWRKRVLGRGSGTTEQMKGLARDWVQMAWGKEQFLELEAIFEQQLDLYDAACICAYGRLALLDGVVKLR